MWRSWPLRTHRKLWLFPDSLRVQLPVTLTCRIQSQTNWFSQKMRLWPADDKDIYCESVSCVPQQSLVLIISYPTLPWSFGVLLPDWLQSLVKSLAGVLQERRWVYIWSWSFKWNIQQVKHRRTGREKTWPGLPFRWRRCRRRPRRARRWEQRWCRFHWCRS